MKRENMPSNSSALLAQRLRIFTGRLRRRLLDASALDGLSAPQASALARLVSNEPSSASELAAAERVRPQSMIKTLATLHDRGLIRREVDADDGRRLLIFLTDEGRARMRGARTSRAEWLPKVLELRFSESELMAIDHALTLLERVVEP
jgi:DNA-binding MarR family transcriptional regulator